MLVYAIDGCAAFCAVMMLVSVRAIYVLIFLETFHFHFVLVNSTVCCKCCAAEIIMSESSAVEVVGGKVGDSGAKKRKIPLQMAALPCPVFEATAEDLLNFDRIIHHLWHEKQAWRAGIAKVVLKPCARALIDPSGSGITWDNKQADDSFWGKLCEVEVARVNRQSVTKLVPGVYLVNNLTEKLAKQQEEKMTVGKFFEQALAKGLVHPDEVSTVQNAEMPCIFYTSDVLEKMPARERLAVDLRGKFWSQLENLLEEEGASTEELAYVTELSIEPVEEKELEERLDNDGPKRIEVSCCVTGT